MFFAPGSVNRFSIPFCQQLLPWSFLAFKSLRQIFHNYFLFSLCTLGNYIESETFSTSSCQVIIFSFWEALTQAVISSCKIRHQGIIAIAGLFFFFSNQGKFRFPVVVCSRQVNLSSSNYYYSVFNICIKIVVTKMAKHFVSLKDPIFSVSTFKSLDVLFLSSFLTRNRCDTCGQIFIQVY